MIQFATKREQGSFITGTSLDDQEVWREIRDFADSMLSRGRCGSDGALAMRGVRQFTTPEGRYYARAEGDGERGVLLVAIERTEPRLPTLFELRRRFDLTPREAEVAVLLGQRRSNREVASELDVTPHTARRHTEKVLVKLNVSKRTEVRRVLLETLEAAA